MALDSDHRHADGRDGRTDGVRGALAEGEGNAHLQVLA